MNNYKRKPKLTNLSFTKLLLSTIIITLSMSVTVLVDGLFVGNLVGTDQFAALNMITPLVTLVVMVYVLIGFGGSTYFSVLKGKLETENGNKLFTVNVIALGIIGILAALSCYIFKPQVVNLLCSDVSLHGYITEYLDVYLIQMPILLVFGGLAYFCRVDNSPKIAAASIIVANLVNIVLDYVYIKWFGLGIAGAAWASISGYIVGYGVLILYFVSKERTISFTKSALSFKNIRFLGESIRYSGPSALNEGVLSICMLTINNMVIKYAGVDGMAVFAVFNQASMLYLLFHIGVAETMAPVVGVSLGERDIRAIGFVLKYSAKVLIISTLTCFIVFEVFATEILNIFGVTDASLVQKGVSILHVLNIALIPAAIPYFMLFYYQLIKRDVLSISIVIVLNVCTFVPAMWILGEYVGSNAIWWSQTISETLTIVYIIVASYVIIKRSNGRYKTIFLIDRQMETKNLDLTLCAACEQDIKCCWSYIHDFLHGHGHSFALCNGVANLFELEANNRASAGVIDVVVSIDEEKVTMRLRDKGKQLSEEHQVSKHPNIDIVRYDYQETLNLNVATYIITSSSAKQ